MPYFQILSCSGDLGNCCNSTSMAVLFDVIRRIVDLIQIIAPILLIIMATVSVSKLVANPDEKDGAKKIINQFLAAAIIFFIPIIVDVILNITPQTFSVSACWKQSKRIAETSRSLKPQYTPIDSNRKRTPIVSNSDDYEKGVKDKKAETGVENTANTNSNISTPNIVPGAAKGILDGAEKVHTMYEQQGWSYYSSLDQLRWNDINYSTNNPSRRTCCATFVGSALFIGGVFSESEINKYNYNLPDDISRLCQEHSWIKITNYGQLAAGDVVIMTLPGDIGGGPGHTQIYAGNGNWYNAGSTQAIQTDNPYPSDASSRFLYAWRKPA